VTSIPTRDVGTERFSVDQGTWSRLASNLQLTGYSRKIPVFFFLFSFFFLSFQLSEIPDQTVDADQW
jgi:hypothetical protein